MNGFSRLAYVETKLFLRETGAAIGVFGLPVALVIGFGMIPGFGDPQKGLSGQIGTEYIASIGVGIVLAVLGMTGVPMVIGQYRERGILRRLGVTPVRPLTLLLADLMVWAAAAILSVAVVIGVAGWPITFRRRAWRAGSSCRCCSVSPRCSRSACWWLRWRRRPGVRPDSAGCCSSRTCSWPASTSRPNRCRR
jgi:hypothetical protein